MAAILLAFLCVTVLSVKGQIERFGNCPNITGSADFKIIDYVGVWYEAQGYLSLFDIPVRCSAMEYGRMTNGNLLVRKYYTDLANRPKTINGLAVIDKQVPYRLHWKLPKNIPLSDFQTEVLYTDYKDFAIVWACREMLFLRNEYVWIMTRQRVASAETITAAKDKMRELGLNTEWLIDVDQSRCKDVKPKLPSDAVPAESMSDTATDPLFFRLNSHLYILFPHFGIT